MINLLIRLLQPGGLKSVSTENLLLKQQLLIIRRPMIKLPNLKTSDRFIFGWLTMLLSPNHLAKSAVIVKLSTLLSFHKALVQRKYRQLFSSTGKGKHGPKGPNSDLIKAIIEIKQRNSNFGYPRIALIIRNTFGIEINKDRECLDQTLFWNDVDLQNKLNDFTDYYNNDRVHASLDNEIPANFGQEKLHSVASLNKFNWKTLCR
jgi:hypothetical protein